MASVLLVEDDPGVVKLLRIPLQQNNYQVSQVDNGAALMEAWAKKERPDIVLLNYLLPDEAGRPPEKIGLTLLRLIKRQLPKTEVIMFTGDRTPDVAFQAGRLGAFAFINKPCELDTLLEVLGSALDSKQPTRDEKTLPFPADEPLTPLERTERDMIFQVLKATGGNKLETAKHLGIGRQTLYNKIKAYGIEV